MKPIKKLVIASAVLVGAVLSNNRYQFPPLPVANLIVVDTPPKIHKEKRKQKGNLHQFLFALARQESGGNEAAISSSNTMDYFGKYQFSSLTLQTLHVDVSKREFLENGRLQDSVMMLYMKLNSQLLRGVIHRFGGRWKNGIFITKSGILAGAHLVGVGGVLSFFYPEKYHYPTSDANGTTVADYMKKFGGYSLVYGS